MDDDNYKEEFYKSLKENNIQTIDNKDIEINKSNSNRIKITQNLEVYPAKLYGKTKAMAYIFFNVDYKNLMEEINALTKVNHPNIQKFVGISSDNQSTITFLFEHLEGCTLKDFDLSLLDDKQKIYIVSRISDALNYLHSIDIVHRYINHHTIFIEDVTYKPYITDFCYVKFIKDGISEETRVKGDINYFAPELFTAKDHDDDGNILFYYSKKIDSWCFGCVISYIFSGHLPWGTASNPSPPDISILSHLVKKKSDFPVPANIENKKIKEIIAWCTEMEPIQRGSIFDINTEIQNLYSALTMI